MFLIVRKGNYRYGKREIQNGSHSDGLKLEILECISYFLLHHKLPPNLVALNNKHFLSTSLCGSEIWELFNWCFKPRVPHKVAASVSARAIIISRLIRGLIRGFRLLTRGFSFLPHSPLHSTAPSMAAGFPRVSHQGNQSNAALLSMTRLSDRGSLCRILFIRTKSLSPAHMQWVGITQGQKWGLSWRLAISVQPLAPCDSFSLYIQNTLTLPPKVFTHYNISSKSRISSSRCR